MGKPKKQTSARKTGLRRSPLLITLARRVNSLLSRNGSPIKAYTTKRESGKKLAHKKAPAKAAKK